MSVGLTHDGQSHPIKDHQGRIILEFLTAAGGIRQHRGTFQLDSGVTVTINSSPTFGADVVISNGFGFLLGHPSQVNNARLGTEASPDAAEFQQLGTGVGNDSKMTLGNWGANAEGPGFGFIKSRDPVIADGTFAIVTDNDVLGGWFATPDDGADYATLAAVDLFEVDDGSPAAGDIGTAKVIRLMPGGGGALRTTWSQRADASIEVVNGAPKMTMGTVSAFASTQPTNAIVLRGGTAFAGAITTASGLHASATILVKVIADGTVSNVET